MSTELQSYAGMGKQHARSLTPEIYCYAIIGGWHRTHITVDWSDEECLAFTTAYDQERGALYKLSENYGP